MKNQRHLKDPKKVTCIRQRMKQFILAALMTSMMLTNLAFVVTGISVGEEVDLNQPEKLKRIADAAMLQDSL